MKRMCWMHKRSLSQWLSSIYLRHHSVNFLLPWAPPCRYFPGTVCQIASCLNTKKHWDKKSALAIATRLSHHIPFRTHLQSVDCVSRQRAVSKQDSIVQGIKFILFMFYQIYRGVVLLALTHYIYSPLAQPPWLNKKYKRHTKGITKATFMHLQLIKHQLEYNI